jgi:5-methylcytosine-specific restriction endonuclease McrA
MHTLSDQQLITQICRVCKESKSVEHYSIDKRAKSGYNSLCRECDKAKGKTYYEKNKQARLEYRRNYRQNNPEKIAKRMKNWQLNNPEKINQYSRARQQKKLLNGLFQISKKELQSLYNSICFYCGSKNEIQTDHVIPIAKGGRTSIGNLVPACRRCNQSKGAKLLVEWKYKK